MRDLIAEYRVGIGQNGLSNPARRDQRCQILRNPASGLVGGGLILKRDLVVWRDERRDVDRRDGWLPGDRGQRDTLSNDCRTVWNGGHARDRKRFVRIGGGGNCQPEPWLEVNTRGVPRGYVVD
jgi:hypothetical protein